jgi:hypothetical protein
MSGFSLVASSLAEVARMSERLPVIYKFAEMTNQKTSTATCSEQCDAVYNNPSAHRRLLTQPDGFFV